MLKFWTIFGRNFGKLLPLSGSRFIIVFSCFYAFLVTGIVDFLLFLSCAYYLCNFYFAMYTVLVLCVAGGVFYVWKMFTFTALFTFTFHVFFFSVGVFLVRNMQLSCVSWLSIHGKCKGYDWSIVGIGNITLGRWDKYRLESWVHARVGGSLRNIPMEGFRGRRAFEMWDFFCRLLTGMVEVFFRFLFEAVNYTAQSTRKIKNVERMKSWWWSVPFWLWLLSLLLLLLGSIGGTPPILVALLKIYVRGLLYRFRLKHVLFFHVFCFECFFHERRSWKWVWEEGCERSFTAGWCDGVFPFKIPE